MSRPQEFPPGFAETLVQRLASDRRVRRSLPVWGRISIDRRLPFLCIFRRRPGGKEDGTERFVLGEAAYLTAAGGRRIRTPLAELVRRIAESMRDQFGAFLVVEVWAGSETRAGDESPPVPAFQLHVGSQEALRSTAEVLLQALGRVRVQKHSAAATVAQRPIGHAPGLPALMAWREEAARGIHWLGIEIAPVWRRTATDETFPILHRSLVRQFGRGLRRALFEFTRTRTTHRPPHFHALGKRAMVKAVWEADRQLAEVDGALRFLLWMTPANPDAAFAAFERGHFEKPPDFLYRPIPIDPALVKRNLYSIRIERIEDPTMAALLRGKRRELDLQLSLLSERDTPRALHYSQLLFGGADRALVALARDLLERIPPRSRESSGAAVVDGAAFARRAEEELRAYRDVHPDFPAKVTLRGDLTGLLVSHGELLVGRSARIPEARVEPLLQHEVGTHVLTYYNGMRQPLRLLRYGLPGYDELQEGLAVLAEHMVDGLSRPRLRLLAARVVAVRDLLDGAGFVESFRRLHDELGFSRQAAFGIAMRVHRGGGLTKDAAYLRGLVRLLDYLRAGGTLDPLFVGKISAEHVAVIRELQRRKVLRPVAALPRYFERPSFRERLVRLQEGATPFDLVSGEKR